MKALVIGFGSIGRRHADVLEALGVFSDVDIVTKSSPDGRRCFHSLADSEDLNGYDYFVIADETSKHLADLKFLDATVKNKTILCEKPLFVAYDDFVPVNNTVYLGYVLRFHPVIAHLRQIIRNYMVLDASVYCGSYLPEWRDGDYRQCYSAKKEMGGGALLDLSHELDYVAHLFGSLSVIKSVMAKVSSLEIDTEDTVHIIGHAGETLVDISLNYISRIPVRTMTICCDEMTIRADLVNYSYEIKIGDAEPEVFRLKKSDRNAMFKDMHTAALTDGKYLCTYQEGLDIMKTIKYIQDENI